MNKINQTYRNIRCVTLIEVMVAIVITSIGILGFASLQFLGLNSNQTAYYRSQASFLATDLSERMRGNIEGMNANAYRDFDSQNPDFDLDGTVDDCDTVPTNFCDERNNSGTVQNSTACSDSQRAANDLFVATCGYSGNDYSDHSEKSNFLGDILPGGRIRILCDDSVTTDGDVCTNFSDHIITISWTDQDEDATNQGGDNVDNNMRIRTTTKNVTYRVRL